MQSRNVSVAIPKIIIIYMFGKLTNVSVSPQLHMGLGIVFGENDVTLCSDSPKFVGDSPSKHWVIPISEVWRAILTQKNENVGKINEAIMDKFPGIGHTYLLLTQLLKMIWRMHTQQNF